jgi:hypothetical protein
LAGPSAEEIFTLLSGAAEVKVAPHLDALKLIEAARRALAGCFCLSLASGFPSGATMTIPKIFFYYGTV